MENFIKLFCCIFIFTLIVSGNFLAEIFPCKIQTLMSNNILMKHVFGLLTLFFFAVLTIPDFANKKGILLSVLLYTIFLINAKTRYEFWIATFILYTIVYVLHIFKSENITRIEKETLSEDDVNRIEKQNKIMSYVQVTLLSISILNTIVGFLVYMGQKKTEYKQDFKYLTFILGKSSCKNNFKDESNQLSILESLKRSFKPLNKISQV